MELGSGSPPGCPWRVGLVGGLAEPRMEPSSSMGAGPLQLRGSRGMSPHSNLSYRGPLLLRLACSSSFGYIQQPAAQLPCIHSCLEGLCP